MYPKLFGIIDTYYILLIIGFFYALIIVYLYLKKQNVSSKVLILVSINALLSIFMGLVFAILFQNLYDYIESPNTYQFSFSMTFIGGLIGGVATFILFNFFVVKKEDKEVFRKILVIAPCAITGAHFFGRIGCFFNGCCYGISSDSWLAVQFPQLETKVLPTQLFEALFLLILTILLGFLAFKKNFIYNFDIYLISYAIFRFLIEYIRGDDRGNFIGSLSPSQFWSIILLILGIGLIFLFNYCYDEKKIFKRKVS